MSLNLQNLLDRAATAREARLAREAASGVKTPTYADQTPYWDARAPRGGYRTTGDVYDASAKMVSALLEGGPFENYPRMSTVTLATEGDLVDDFVALAFYRAVRDAGFQDKIKLLVDHRPGCLHSIPLLRVVFLDHRVFTSPHRERMAEPARHPWLHHQYGACEVKPHHLLADHMFPFGSGDSWGHYFQDVVRAILLDEEHPLRLYLLARLCEAGGKHLVRLGDLRANQTSEYPRDWELYDQDSMKENGVLATWPAGPTHVVRVRLTPSPALAFQATEELVLEVTPADPGAAPHREWSEPLGPLKSLPGYTIVRVLDRYGPRPPVEAAVDASGRVVLAWTC